MSLKIVGPFSTGVKSQVLTNVQSWLFSIHNTYLKLNAIKTCSVGGALVNLLFFTCSVGKFCVIQQDNLVADKLQVMKTYFVKNVKEQVDNVYLASEFTVLTESKKPIKTSERFWRNFVNIFVEMILHSFQDNEIEELLAKVRDADLVITPPTSKRVKLEEPSTSNEPSIISLSSFVTTPHSKTKDSFVQVVWIQFK